MFELRLDAAEVLDLVYASDQPGAILLAVVDDAGGDFTVARVGAREIERVQELEFIAQRVAANGVEVGLVLDDGRVVECAKRVANLPLSQINAGAALRLFRLLVLTFSGFRRFELSARLSADFASPDCPPWPSVTGMLGNRMSTSFFGAWPISSPTGWMVIFEPSMPCFSIAARMTPGSGFC